MRNFWLVEDDDGEIVSMVFTEEKARRIAGDQYKVTETSFAEWDRCLKRALQEDEARTVANRGNQ